MGVDEDGGNAVANRIETLITQLSSRFELVVEVAADFGGRLDQLREEMVSQFAEVGRQIRFLADRIGDNQSGLESMRSELALEMVRLNEALGAARIQLKQDLSGIQDLRQAVHELSAARPAADLSRGLEEARRKLGEELDKRTTELRREIGSRLDRLTRAMGGEGSAERKGAWSVAEDAVGELHSEVKSTNKSLASLIKKFERFDDRLSVQIKDQDQRLRKLERRAKA